MKNLAVVAAGENTSMAFRGQLYRLLGNRVNVSHYCLAEGLPNVIEADVALFASAETHSRARSHVSEGTPFLVARRSIDYHEIGKLFEIPAGTDVLLVNDLVSSTEETIALLQTLGINHINYHPYAPQMKTHAVFPIAVTPGERQLVPSFVQKIIDIKTRLIDLTTLVELLLALGLLADYVDFLSANYVQDMIHLIRNGMETVQKSDRMKATFQTVIQTVHDGIIATDGTGRISVFNPVAEQLFQLDAKSVIGRTKGAVEDGDLRALLNGSSDAGEALIKIKRRHLVVNVTPLQPEQAGAGEVYTFKDVSEIRRLEEVVRRKLLREQKVAKYTFAQIIGESGEIKATLAIAEKMARSDSTILIQGESGTGKEMIAQGIHNASPRREGPFVAVNFAALTENLLESELFGYVEGAFTGASRGGAPGLFEEAHKGTIFLDEIGDAPLSFQVKLLRVLQERQIRRVGSAKVIPIDVRVVVATNRDLKALIAKGTFRQDLYYRLNVLPIRVPPLRSRETDILLLAKAFYESGASGGYSLPAKIYFQWIDAYLMRYAWPGNIRELHNVIEYLVNLSPDRPPEAALLPEDLRLTIGDAAERKLCERRLKALLCEEIASANERNRCVGRRSLAQRLQLPENRVRTLLKKLQAEGTIEQRRGRKGLKINSMDKK